MVAHTYLADIACTLFSYLPGSPRLAWYRLRGARIGTGVVFGVGSQLRMRNGYGGLRIGDRSVIEDRVVVDVGSCSVAPTSHVSAGARIEGEKDFSLGVGSRIGRNASIEASCDVSIGERVLLDDGCVIKTRGVWHSTLDGAPGKNGPVFIGDRAWIGANATLYPGISVGEEAVVEAGSVVAENVAAGVVVGGNPLREVTRTFRVWKSISLPEKNKGVLAVLEDFLRLHDADVGAVERGEDRLSFMLATAGGDTDIHYVARMESIRDVLAHLERKRGSTILVFLSSNKVLRRNLLEKGHSLIDLENDVVANPNEATKRLSAFLASYGVTLLERKATR